MLSACVSAALKLFICATESVQPSCTLWLLHTREEDHVYLRYVPLSINFLLPLIDPIWQKKKIFLYFLIVEVASGVLWETVGSALFFMIILRFLAMTTSSNKWKKKNKWKKIEKTMHSNYTPYFFSRSISLKFAQKYTFSQFWNQSHICF